MAEQKRPFVRRFFRLARFFALSLLVVYVLFGLLFMTIPFYPFNPLVAYRHFSAQGLSKRSIIGAALWGLASFSPEKWKAYAPRLGPPKDFNEYWKAGSAAAKRRRMANDFLAKHAVVGMTVPELKSLLGEHDYEYDVWIYYLSDKDALPPGPHGGRVFDEHPYLYVKFRDGKANKIDVSGKVQSGDQFNPVAWRTMQAPDRLSMASSATKDESLLGKSKEELASSLGNPDKTDPEHKIDYDLGIPRLDVVTLTFYLGPDGHVTRAGIFEH